MLDKPLSDMKNIGLKTTARLHEVGIDSFKDLEAIGAIEAYKRLKIAFPRDVTLNALYGLQAALLNIHWNALTSEMKTELKAQAED